MPDFDPHARTHLCLSLTKFLFFHALASSTSTSCHPFPWSLSYPLSLYIFTISSYSMCIPYSPISFLFVSTAPTMTHWYSPLSIKRELPYTLAPSLTFVPVLLYFRSLFLLFMLQFDPTAVYRMYMCSRKGSRMYLSECLKSSPRFYVAVCAQLRPVSISLYVLLPHIISVR